ncbi:MAG: hypothetical protein ACKOXO_01930 [Cyanobium sp.]
MLLSQIEPGQRPRRQPGGRPGVRNQQPSSDRRRARSLEWLATAAALLSGGLALTPAAALAEAEPVGTTLYTLQTNCTVRGSDQRCQVEALDGKDATVYRTTIDGARTSFRLIDAPGKRAAQLWNHGSGNWTGLDRLSLDFETRTLCLNGDQLCVVNPNYFASLKQTYPDLRSDLIMARFDGKTGLLAAICYSREACHAGF